MNGSTSPIVQHNGRFPLLAKLFYLSNRQQQNHTVKANAPYVGLQNRDLRGIWSL